MGSSLSGDEGQIKALLAGDAKAVASALNWIDANYRYKVGGLLRYRFPGLSAEDVAEVWQESLLSLYRMTLQGTFELDGSLEGLVWRIAVRRGQDRLRRNDAWHHPIDVLMQDLPQPQLVQKWQALDALQRREIVELICESIERLPPRQELVWRVYVAHFPDAQRLDRLTEAVRESRVRQRDAAGRCEPLDIEAEVTKKSVSAALYAGREKIREDLKRRGYDL